MYVERDGAAAFERLAAGFPAVLITGPRQSGKTTFARHARTTLPYATLERPDERSYAEEDPAGFLARFPQGAILDEVQRVPSLLSWLQGVLDESSEMGRFVLTGSHRPDLAAAVSQSLAGRVGRLELLPFAAHELLSAAELAADMDAVMWQGGYPAIFDRHVSPTDWLGSYVATYVERDVRSLLDVRDHLAFTRFVRACAARSAQLLNATSIGNDVGISGVTASTWLSVLRATYIVTIIEPYAANVTTRIVKSPKPVMLDSGLHCYLLGINDAHQLAHHPLRGFVFESWGISEIVKALGNRGLRADVGFLRDKSGLELDLVVRIDGTLVPIEFKAGRTYASEWSKPSTLWKERMPGETWGPTTIVYGGDDSFTRSGVRVLSWRDFARDPLALD